MSFEEFVIPALPQPPAAGFNQSVALRSAAPHCPCSHERADDTQSFLATLNQISDAKDHRSPQEPFVENSQGPVDRSDGEDSTSLPSTTASDRPDNVQPGSLAVAGIPSPGAAAVIDLEHALRLVGTLSAAMGKLDEPPTLFEALSDSLTADISPPAASLFYFKQLMAQAAFDPAADGQQAIPVQVFKFRQWMAQLPEGLTGLQPQTLLSAGQMTIGDLFPLQWALGADTAIAGRGEQLSAAPADVIQMLKKLVSKMQSNSATHSSAGSENRAFAAGSQNQTSKIPMPNGPILDAGLDPERGKENNNLPRFESPAVTRTAAQPAIQNPSAEGAVAKPAEAALSIGGAASKPQVPVADALGGKVFHIEADTKDSSLLYANDQMPERMGKPEDAARSTESAQRSFSSAMLHQIVQKAVLSLKNGQNEVRIDLKPDFWGHIRMQIVTENQQVAVKIFAEFPFVKDMLESNLHHLKAELQAQGLEIDELQVCVADDTDREADPNADAAELRKLKATGSGKPSDAAAAEDPLEPNPDDGDHHSETAIDYFA